MKAAININGAGEITTRSEMAESIECIRTDVGEYEITGAIGMATDGWRTGVPRDDDGQRMIGVEIAEVEGTVLVSTSINGTPADIPTGRVLSIRLDVAVIEPEPEPEPA
ncbi:hypothetical protein [uncultured Brevundimonas sp.]|uniref:phage tail fiber protein n=1 Tax=uncultured Brevundimonas sp. TaxID=213418 RepID=UPI0030EE580C|tara:strand:+ start:24607 stop:24933 length:327 start_codon:yes stop_codon:yes gene_type:complete